MPAATNPTRSTPVTHSVPGGGGGGATAAAAAAASSASTNNGGSQSEGESNVLTAGGSGGAERCPIGATVRCTVQSPETVTYEGEVLAYDPKKVLVLKCPSSSGRTSLFNVHMVNLSLPCEWKILSEKRETVADPPSLNVSRLHNRQRDQVERKKKQIMAFKAGVSLTGQKLFQAISKTIDDVSWSGENISVLKEVTISPPYSPDDVRGNADSKALKHVRKIVEKHMGDQQQQLTTTTAAVQSRASPAADRNASSSYGDQRNSEVPPAKPQMSSGGGRGTGRRTPPTRSSTGSARSHDHHNSPHGSNQHHHNHQHSPKPPFNQ